MRETLSFMNETLCFMNETLSFMNETLSFMDEALSFMLTWSLILNIASGLSHLRVLCGYPIDIQNQRTYLSPHAEATPES